MLKFDQIEKKAKPLICNNIKTPVKQENPLCCPKIKARIQDSRSQKPFSYLPLSVQCLRCYYYCACIQKFQEGSKNGKILWVHIFYFFCRTRQLAIHLFFLLFLRIFFFFLQDFLYFKLEKGHLKPSFFRPIKVFESIVIMKKELILLLSHARTKPI